MILPIVGYGTPILRKVASELTADYKDLDKLIASMWETMYNSNGVGLAAPQVNRDIRLFVMDSKQIFANQEPEDKGKYPDAPGVAMVVINPTIISYSGDEWAYNEGCLSIPKVREDVIRPDIVTIEFYDETFQKHTASFNGISSRIIQHEYDHIEGKLFIDYLKPLRKKLIASKLKDITKGVVKVDYKMMFQKK